MEYLYHELDADSAAEFRSHVGGCTRCSAELAGLERTRKALRSLPDIDPPPSVTALLLHEAARRAPAQDGEKQGFWAWITGFLQPIVAHPALAAAASLVLVAGVAGYLSMRGLVSHHPTTEKLEPKTSIELVPEAQAPTGSPAQPQAEEPAVAEPPAAAVPPAADDKTLELGGAKGNEEVEKASRRGRIASDEAQRKLEKDRKSVV